MIRSPSLQSANKTHNYVPLENPYRSGGQIEIESSEPVLSHRQGDQRSSATRLASNQSTTQIARYWFAQNSMEMHKQFKRMFYRSSKLFW